MAPALKSHRLPESLGKNRQRLRLPYGRDSATLSQHETFVPNRERERPVLLDFSRILTVAVRSQTVQYFPSFQVS